MAELANCPHCGQLFMKCVRNICMPCYEKEEEQFETVYQFIRDKKNRRATMAEICEATGVADRTIHRFIKEGRLQLADFPNLNYPCESCGVPIRQGKLCASCTYSLRKGLDTHEKEKAFEKRKQESLRVPTYFSDPSRKR